ncbi:MAG: hypothetical protein EOO01_25670, partial [Chitinophagaceae bacterium]
GIYNFELFFSHIYGYQFPEIPLVVAIQSPDGDTATERFMLKIKNNAGDELGDCAGDYCDLRQLILPGKALKPGHYEVKISHEFNGAFLPNVLATGLKVSAKNESR